MGGRGGDHPPHARPAEAGYGVTVTDCRTGRPIAGAAVTALTSTGQPREAKTRGEGYSELYPAPPDREHQFSLTASGYQSKTRTLFISSKQVTREKVCLDAAVAAAPSAPATVSKPPDIVAQPPGEEPERKGRREPGVPAAEHARRAMERLRELLGEGAPPGEQPPPVVVPPRGPAPEEKEADRLIRQRGQAIEEKRQPPDVVPRKRCERLTEAKRQAQKKKDECDDLRRKHSQAWQMLQNYRSEYDRRAASYREFSEEDVQQFKKKVEKAEEEIPIVEKRCLCRRWEIHKCGKWQPEDAPEQIDCNEVGRSWDTQEFPPDGVDPIFVEPTDPASYNAAVERISGWMENILENYPTECACPLRR